VCLAVAAVYSESWPIFLILGAALFTSQWFDLAHVGYFGKLIAYPSALFLAGLTLISRRTPSPVAIFNLAILAAAIGTMHAGMVTSLLIAPILLVELVVSTQFKRAATAKTADVLPSAQQYLMIVGLVMLLPAVTSGLFSRISAISYHGSPHVKRWWVVVPRALDLASNGNLNGMTYATLYTLTAAGLCAALVVLVLAVIWRNPEALALSVGPFFLLAVFYCIHNRSAGFELTGWIYPASLCATCALLSGGADRKRKAIVFILIVSIGFRVSRIAGALDRYVLKQRDSAIYTASEIDRIANQVGSAPALIDVRQTIPGLVLLVETGRRGMNVQWSPYAWEIAVGYRHWPWPPTAGAKATIGLSQDRTMNYQFELRESNSFSWPSGDSGLPKD